MCFPSTTSLSPHVNVPLTILGQASIAGSFSKGRSSAGGRNKEPTDLSELKAGNVLGAPYLKGELVRDVHGDHVFRGMWSLDYKSFESGGVKSEFELKHRSTDPDDCEVS